jgi:hypothetical protein
MWLSNMDPGFRRDDVLGLVLLCVLCALCGYPERPGRTKGRRSRDRRPFVVQSSLTDHWHVGAADGLSM